jgi:nucleoporin GLE1
VVDLAFGTVAAFADYYHYEKKVEEYAGLSQTFEREQFKPLRDHVIKTVKTSFNTLSAVQSSIRDKTNTFTELLTNLRSLDIAYRFALHEIADYLTKQAQMQVARRPETAFPYAYVVLRVCEADPPLFEVIVAHLVHACPYVAPVYPPPLQGESSVHHKLRALRYKPRAEGGEVEADEAYTMRMKGVIALLAVLYSFPVGSNQFQEKRCSLGWTWIARTLNTPPIGITAELLCSFLEQSGIFMLNRYRNQFAKIMNLIHRQFIPKVPSSGAAAFASKTRLLLLVEKAIKSNYSLGIPKGAEIEQANNF